MKKWLILGKHQLARTPPDAEEPLSPSSSVLHRFKHAAICSDSEECSRIAK